MSESSIKSGHFFRVIALVLLAVCAKQQAGASNQTLERGRSIYLTHCVVGHSERGDGEGIRRAGLGTRPRNFRDRRWRAQASPRKVEETIRNGGPGLPMPPFRILTEEEVRDVAAL